MVRVIANEFEWLQRVSGGFRRWFVVSVATKILMKFKYYISHEVLHFTSVFVKNTS